MSPLNIYEKLASIYHREHGKEITAEALGDMWRKFANYVARQHGKVKTPRRHTLALFPLVVLSHAMSLAESEDYDALEEMSKRTLDEELRSAIDEATAAGAFKE